MKVLLPRMQSYVNQSSPRIHNCKAERLMEERGDFRAQVYRTAAEYFATINPQRWRGEHAQDAASPCRQKRRVIYTEYDLHEKPSAARRARRQGRHRLVFENVAGRRRSDRQATEFAIPEHKPGFPRSSAERADRDGNLWLGNMYQAAIVKFDRKTENSILVARRQNIDAAQINMVSPQSLRRRQGEPERGFAGAPARHVRQNRDLGAVHERAEGRATIYDVIPDAQNNVYFTDFRHRHIGRIDAKTGRCCSPFDGWFFARRGQMDA